MPDGAQERVIAEWLGQKLDSSRLHGPDRHRHVAIASDEDDWHVNPIACDALLQFETIEVRKRNVKYQAARNQGSRTGKEFLRRRKDLRLPAFEADQRFQRFAHRNVIVNNEHGETEQRLYGLDAWEESPYYTDRERAALHWTEALTLVREHHVPDTVYEAMRPYFSENELADLSWAIAAINAWNRSHRPSIRSRQP